MLYSTIRTGHYIIVAGDGTQSSLSLLCSKLSQLARKLHPSKIEVGHGSYHAQINDGHKAKEKRHVV